MALKKLIAATLAVVMIAGFTGCSDKADSSSKSESGTDSAVSGNPEAAMPEKAFETSTDGSARITVDGTKFVCGGSEIWMNGVNSAWDKWNDFGGGFSFEFWQDHFQKLHEAGVNSDRIWIVCNGDVGMLIDTDGNFEGATTAHWEDIDDLMYLAEQYHIYVMATMQSFDNYKDSNKTYQGWRTLIQDSAKTDEYIDKYIIPFAQRYGNSDYLWSIDLCNEPDWIVENAECGNLDFSNMQRFYARAAAAIHQNSKTLVTVGMGMIKYNSDKFDGNKISNEALAQAFGDDSKYDKSLAYVDFYSTHWYPWMMQSFGRPFDKTPTDFGLDGTKPCVIGECPATDKSEKYDLVSYYQQSYENGWNGVFAWKAAGGNDGCGIWDDIKPSIEKIMSICPEKVFPLNDQQIG